YTQIYNDAYRPMLGSTKHLGAMGASARDVWREVWGQLGPMFDHVLTTGEPVWRVDEALLVERSGFTEETFFTFSYSALRVDGEVRGVLDIATETTLEVVERRRMRTLSTLAGRLQTLPGGVGDVGRVTLDVLAGARADVMAVEVHVATDGGALALLGSTDPDALTLPGSVGSDREVDAADLASVLTSRRAVEVGRTLVAPLVATGDHEAAGVIVLVAHPWRPLDEEYRSFLRLVTVTVSNAMSATLRHAREVGELRRVSDALQHAMLPRGPAVPGVVARYRPAVGNLAVGGDWYDVVELGRGRRALIVGDCVGHGLEAATVMGQLRSATRALLLEGHGPAATLAGLDRFAEKLPGAACTTVFCGVVDEATGRLTYSSAGHLPGLVVTPGEPGTRPAGEIDGQVPPAGTSWLDGGRGMPLAVGEDERHDATTDIAPGSTVILYTDGLVERRGSTLRRGLARLLDAVGRHPATIPADALADAVLAELTDDAVRDDVALLLYRPRGH
ncbi:MAG: serine/threonine-protein phosphatase, partial [Cellulomonadaceae bacterium]|nr:serine/threonine-protein phosphatase [Cellulomonadaceae bacterium]